MGPRRALFVDDDAHLLHGIRRTLKLRAPQLDAVFANGGAAALQELDHSAFDVVVSDMRMPDIDGIDVLTYARTKQPSALRMLLSGFTDHESMVRVLPVAHQLFSKPIHMPTLLLRMGRACDLRAYIPDAEVRAAINGVACLPTTPALHAEVTQLLRAPHVDFRTVANVVARDPAMTLRVLQLASSSFFNVERSIISVGEAVAIVGLDLIRRLADGPQPLFSSSQPCGNVALEELRSHSHAIAVHACSLVREADADTTYAAGLLHDIGKLATGVTMPDADPDVRHAEIGAYLLGILGLPHVLVEAVAAHADPASTSEIAVAVSKAHAAVAADPRIATARLHTSQLLPIR